MPCTFCKTGASLQKLTQEASEKVGLGIGESLIDLNLNIEDRYACALEFWRLSERCLFHPKLIASFNPAEETSDPLGQPVSQSRISAILSPLLTSHYSSLTLTLTE